MITITIDMSFRDWDTTANLSWWIIKLTPSSSRYFVNLRRPQTDWIYFHITTNQI